MVDLGAFYPYSPREHLRETLREYVPEYMLLAKWLADKERWATELRAKVTELLGPQPERCPLDIRLYHAERYYGYTAERISYNSEAGIGIPAYICVPDNIDTPIPAVICLHDRGPGKIDLINPEGDQEAHPHHAFTRELAKRGYVTIAPDLRCFGECLADEAAMSALALLLGRPMLGLRVWDTIRALEVLETRPEVRRDRIGCTGLGLGGLVTLFTAAVDERIAAACVCGCLTTYQDMLLAADGNLPGVSRDAASGEAFDHLPGLLRYADLYDVACLVSPRPLKMLQGTRDPGYVAPAAERCGRLIRQGYEALGEKIKAEVELFDGGRIYPGEPAYQFLDDWLKLGLET
jgi:dienelactone hydrolase